MAMATGTTAGTLAGGQAATGAAQRYYRRFTRVERVQHAFLMLTFVGCALSGLPLLYADKPWAATLARILGGFEGAGLIHRICAFVIIVVFVSHLAMLVKKALAGDLMKILWGPDSMVPQLQDGLDIYRNFMWFIGRGPRPQFDRWTYWEKFDYFAVFWGVFIIGASGLIMWLPRVLHPTLPAM